MKTPRRPTHALPPGSTLTGKLVQTRKVPGVGTHAVWFDTEPEAAEFHAKCCAALTPKEPCHATR